MFPLLYMGKNQYHHYHHHHLWGALTTRIPLTFFVPIIFHSCKSARLYSVMSICFSWVYTGLSLFKSPYENVTWVFPCFFSIFHCDSFDLHCRFSRWEVSGLKAAVFYMVASKISLKLCASSLGVSFRIFSKHFVKFSHTVVFTRLPLFYERNHHSNPHQG